ncbi:uncharacterized protein, partial [Dendropsophus ebraccatus]|uniref:uncharacterized protein n=1 Tax=Dendropsophus ebraccatus TaxID=150705 RepID=UPI00383219C8
MSDSVQDKEMDFEDLTEEEIGISLQMQLLSDERHKDHCDFLLDTLDEQLDQLQSQPSFKTSLRNPDTTRDTIDKQQLHGVSAYKDDDPSDPSDHTRDPDSKKEEYKWRLSQLLGSEETVGEEYQSDTNSAESVCTEDFVLKFKQRMVEPIGSSEAHENAQYKRGEAVVDYPESLSLLLPSSEDSPGDHLNTARREDILQQFKEELEDDLQAALTKNTEDPASGRYLERTDSAESLGGQISRLSQANQSPLSSLQSLGRSSVISHLSLRRGEEHEPVLLPGNSAVRESMSKTEPLPSSSNYQADTEVEQYSYKEQKLSTDTEQSERKTINQTKMMMSNTDTERTGDPTDTMDASWIGRCEGAKNIYLIPTEEEARSRHTVCDPSREDGAGGAPLSRKNNLMEDLTPVDASWTEENTTSSVYKHVAGVPVKSFDAVTVDSDLDSVTTERVRDHIRKALSNSRGDASHKARRFTRSKSSSGRYSDFSKVSTDDEGRLDRSLIKGELKDEGSKRWISSPPKYAESPQKVMQRGFPVTF